MDSSIYSELQKLSLSDSIDFNNQDVKNQFKKLSDNADILYKFIITYNSYMNAKRDYGTGEELSMMEAHILTNIADNPGITVTELATIWDRTTSAISQTVRKLLLKDLAYRVNSTEDAKVFMLYPTERAIEFNLAHKKYDFIDIIKTNKRLLRVFSSDELAVFYSVAEEYTNLLLEGKDKTGDIRN